MSEPETPIAGRLADALRTGTPLDLIPHTPQGRVLEEYEMCHWGNGHDVDAGLVRDLLLRRGLGDADSDPRGLQLRGARIRRRLDLDFVDTPIALELMDCLVEHGASAEQAHLPALRMSRCRFPQHGRPPLSALSADRLRLDGTLDLRESVISAAATDGVVRLANARVGGQVQLRGATLRNTNGPALHAHGLHAGGNVYLDGGFRAEATSRGAVRLISARLGDQLHLEGATLSNSSGPALEADGLQTDGDVLLSDDFTADGAGSSGAVRLTSARIRGQLQLRQATLRNPSGPALSADGMQVTEDVRLDEGFTAQGAGARGVVRLIGAQVGGLLSLQGVTLCNATGPALSAARLQVAEDLCLDEGFTAHGVVRLPGARIAGKLVLSNRAMESPRGYGQSWEIDGFTYQGVPRLAEGKKATNRKALLKLLRTATPRYAAQPYQQLAAAYRAEGHDSDVRQILMEQRRDQMDRGGLSVADWCWAWITGRLLGYGYQPWRALLGLFVVLAVSVGLAFWLGCQDGLARSSPAAVTSSTSPTTATMTSAATPMPCTTVQTIGRGLDLGVPFLPTAPTAAGSCQPTTSGAGEVLTVAHWLLQLFAWMSAALFIAGFTGIVRKT